MLHNQNPRNVTLSRQNFNRNLSERRYVLTCTLFLIKIIQGNVAALAINSDGKQLATASEKGTLIRVWNTETLEKVTLEFKDSQFDEPSLTLNVLLWFLTPVGPDKKFNPFV